MEMDGDFRRTTWEECGTQVLSGRMSHSWELVSATTLQGRTSRYLKTIIVPGQLRLICKHLS